MFAWGRKSQDSCMVASLLCYELELYVCTLAFYFLNVGWHHSPYYFGGDAAADDDDGDNDCVGVGGDSGGWGDGSSGGDGGDGDGDSDSDGDGDGGGGGGGDGIDNRWSTII